MINYKQILLDFEDFIKSQKINLEEENFYSDYEKAVNKMLLAGGKRFRPLLLFSVINSFSPELLKNSFHVAYAIEILHTYSLIHDDLPVMDNADLRRGVQTLHKEYDEVTATLVGDALNTYSFEVLANAPLRDDVKIELIKSLSKNGGLHGMVLGQAIDCHFERTPLNLQQIEYLHKNKTGKLIASSLEMGAIITNNKSLKKELFDFGLELGLLFQIQDDILDVTESSEEAGKTTSNDESKNSFVTYLGLEKAIEQADFHANKIEQKLLKFKENYYNLYINLEQILTKYIYRHKK
jgi:farnesyl diphosphate synthase